MKLIIGIFLLCVATLHGFTLQGQPLETTRYVADCIINNQYSEAISTIDKQPDSQKDPLYTVLKLAAIGMRDVDFDKTIDSALFLTTYQDADRAIKGHILKNGQPTSYSNMLSGMTKAIHASYYLRQKKYVAAMQNGFDAIELMEKAQAADSLNYEVDFFLGLYEFIRSELRTKLWWVLFWYPGSREEGIFRVERCAEHAFITKNAAKLSLSDMYLQDKKSDKAALIITQLKESFPKSRFVMWAEVKYLEYEKKYLKAAQIYDTLSKSYAKEAFGEYNSLFTTTQKAHMYYMGSEMLLAKETCTTLLANSTLNHYKSLKKEIVNLRELCNVARN